MVEAAPSDNNYDDPVYAKFKNVLKGAEMVLNMFLILFREKL